MQEAGQSRSAAGRGRFLKYTWALPASLLGAALACIGIVLGATWRWHSGVAEVTLLHTDRAAPGWARWLPFSAITFGHVVIALTDRHQAALRLHERVHVAQYERWGALFLLAYPAESLLQLLRGRRPYLDNRFEVAAREGELLPGNQGDLVQPVVAAAQRPMPSAHDPG